VSHGQNEGAFRPGLSGNAPSGQGSSEGRLESGERATCPDENELLLFLSGGLEGDLAARINAHIDRCDACRQAVAAGARLGLSTASGEVPMAAPGPAGRGVSPMGPATTLPLGGMDPIGLGATTPAAEVDFARPGYLPGQIVAERYRLEEHLGEGGIGVVCAATHLVLGRPVAIKFLKAAGPESVARFHREARITAMLRHPHIVDVHDVFDLPDGTCAIVMDRLTGESLHHRFRREGPQTVSAMASFLLPVASALGAAHAQGIIHRDLKPENIFLAIDAQGAWTVKVLDFGLAKAAAADGGFDPQTGKLTRTGALLGTPHYMAPEQVFAEKDVDVRADMWALGVILYEGLAGVRPVEGNSFGQIFRQVTMGQIVPLEARLPWIPAPVRDLVHQLLQRDRRSRPSDVRLVHDTLAPFFGARAGGP
jgi:eukaryotic-like serine/threonine-protein kinase